MGDYALCSIVCLTLNYAADMNTYVYVIAGGPGTGTVTSAHLDVANYKRYLDEVGVQISESASGWALRPVPGGDEVEIKHEERETRLVRERDRGGSSTLPLSLRLNSGLG